MDSGKRIFGLLRESVFISAMQAFRLSYAQCGQSANLDPPRALNMVKALTR